MSAFVFASSFSDPPRHPFWEPLVIGVVLAFAIVGGRPWRRAQKRYGQETPLPGIDLQTTRRVAYVAAVVRLIVVFLGGAVLVAAGVLLTQVGEIVIGAAVWVWLAIYFIRNGLPVDRSSLEP